MSRIFANENRGSTYLSWFPNFITKKRETQAIKKKTPPIKRRKKKKEREEMKLVEAGPEGRRKNQVDWESKEIKASVNSYDSRSSQMWKAKTGIGFQWRLQKLLVGYSYKTKTSSIIQLCIN